MLINKKDKNLKLLLSLLLSEIIVIINGTFLMY